MNRRSEKLNDLAEKCAANNIRIPIGRFQIQRWKSIPEPDLFVFRMPANLSLIGLQYKIGICPLPGFTYNQSQLQKFPERNMPSV